MISRRDFLWLLGAAAMVCDHLGVVLYPREAWLREVGRAAYPVFAYLVATGESRDPIAWAWRLFLWGLVSQPVFWWALDSTGLLNIFFTLSGAVLVREFWAQRSPLFWVVLVVASLVPVSYGAAGVLLPVALRVVGKPILVVAAWALVVYGLRVDYLAASVAPFLVSWTCSSGWRDRYRFRHWFYPAHLAALGFCRLFFP